MPKLTVVTRTGDEIAIEDAKPGASVMELMRDNDVPDLLALCGEPVLARPAMYGWMTRS